MLVAYIIYSSIFQQQKGSKFKKSI